MPSDFESLVIKAREVRSTLLIAGEGSEFDAKRFAAVSELTEKVVVFRELVIQGKASVGPRITEFFKTKNYTGLKEALDSYREFDAVNSAVKLEVRGRIVGYLEDLLLSL